MHARTHRASDPLDPTPARLDPKSHHHNSRIFTGQHARRARTWPAIRGTGAALAHHRGGPGRVGGASDPLEAAPATLDAKSRHDYPRIFTGQHARRARTWPAIRGTGATLALHRPPVLSAVD